jgi:hypothetical protein
MARAIATMEPWKAPLPQFIEHIYAKRFGRERPEIVVPVEEHARHLARKKAARKAAKASADAAAELAPAHGRCHPRSTCGSPPSIGG